MSTTQRAKRHNLYFTKVFDARTSVPLGQLVDISLEGVSIQSEAPLACPAAYFLRILVPQQGQSDYRLDFEAQSRWASLEDGAHITGFHIPLLTPQQQEQIERLVNGFGYDKIGEVRLAPAARRPAASEPAPGGFKRLWQSLFSR